MHLSCLCSTIGFINLLKSYKNEEVCLHLKMCVCFFFLGVGHCCRSSPSGSWGQTDWFPTTDLSSHLQYAATWTQCPRANPRSHQLPNYDSILVIDDLYFHFCYWCRPKKTGLLQMYHFIMNDRLKFPTFGRYFILLSFDLMHVFVHIYFQQCTSCVEAKQSSGICLFLAGVNLTSNIHS